MTAVNLYEASVSCRETVDRSRAERKRELLLEVAAERFGPPPTAAAGRLAAATPGDLDRLAARLLSAVGWEDLLRGD